MEVNYGNLLSCISYDYVILRVMVFNPE